MAIASQIRLWIKMSIITSKHRILTLVRIANPIADYKGTLRCHITEADTKFHASGTLTNFSDGAKQPTQRESRIQPRAWLLLEGFCVSCLQI